MKTILSVILVAALSGCVVAPYQPDVVYYPQVQTAYVWDPVATSFFFVYNGNRHYMQRGWDYRRGVPHGHYRR